MYVTHLHPRTTEQTMIEANIGQAAKAQSRSHISSSYMA